MKALFGSTYGGDESAVISGLDIIAQVPAVRRLKARALDMLELRAGTAALDVGCGTGEDVQGLAVVVAPGQAIGVDASAAMVDEARRRAAASRSPATYEVGDATSLPFPDKNFDTVRCERVFQHLESPEAAAAELSRVTAPDGRVAVLDTDWGTLAFWPGTPAVTRRIVDAWHDVLANPFSGRRLPGLLTGAGLRDVRVAAEAVVVKDFPGSPRSLDTRLASNAVSAGAVTQTEADAWLADLSSNTGDYFMSFTMVAACGKRP